MKNQTIRAFVLCCALLGSAILRADNIYYELTDGAWQSTNFKWLAQTFTTGSAAMTLDSIEVWLRNSNEDNSFALNGNYRLDLYATDGSNQPTGSSVATIAHDVFMAAWADETSTYSSLNIALSANTEYAIVLAANSTTISWKYQGSAPVTSSISPTPSFYSWESSDGGSSWTTANPSAGFDLVVSASAVPEPSTYALLGLGAAPVIAAIFRRRRAV